MFLTLDRFEFKTKALKGIKRHFFKLLNDKVKSYRNFNGFSFPQALHRANAIGIIVGNIEKSIFLAGYCYLPLSVYKGCTWNRSAIALQLGCTILLLLSHQMCRKRPVCLSLILRITVFPISAGSSKCKMVSHSLCFIIHFTLF